MARTIINNKQVFQSYVLTTAKYDFSPYEKRIMYRLIELAQKEIEELKPLAKADGIEEMQSYDHAFYAEKLRKAKYDIDDEETCQKILQAIIDKEITLPPPCEVIDSMQKFSAAKVASNFINALENEIKKIQK